MIKLNNLSLGYGDNKLIIDNFSYEFKSGTYALCGESGCGKSTLLKGIAGLITPKSGSAVTDGEKIAFVFQENRLIQSFSAEKNLQLTCDSKDAIKNILLSVELDEELIKRPVSKLSGGQCRRVAIARALLFGGELIILDEPFEGLDFELRKNIAKLIKEKFKLIIVASHDERDIELLSHCEFNRINVEAAR